MKMIVVPLQLWWKKIVIKGEKVHKYFVQDCMKIFFLLYTSLKLHRSSKFDQLLVKKKILHEYYAAAVQTTFSTNFLLNTKVQIALLEIC